MAYFPFFVDIKGLRCLVVGGGKVAFRKVSVLLDFEPEIYVVASELVPELEALGERIEICCREFKETDIERADFVIAGTGDEQLNRKIAKLCEARRIPINVVDMKDACSFIFPALIREKDITVGISTSGSSPTVAKYLKQMLTDAIPDCYEVLVEQLGRYRGYVKERVGSEEIRSKIFKAMIVVGMEHDGIISKEAVDQLISEVLELE